MKRRSDELNVLFKRLYEDNVLGRITNEQFRLLSDGYTEEQNQLTLAIPQKEQQAQTLKESMTNVQRFIDKAKRYSDLSELTPELIQIFLSKIEVFERPVKHSKNCVQKIRISYADIGAVDNAIETGECEDVA